MEGINWHTVFFLFFALTSCALALGVVISGNVVRMSFYLVLALAAVAGLFFLAGAEFLGAMQIMVYVGGTMVLLIFGVMLTARGPFVSMQTGGGQWIAAILVGGALLAVLLQTAFNLEAWIAPPKVAQEEAAPTEAPAAAAQPSASEIGLGLLGVRVDRLKGDAAQGVRSGYLLPFEIISVHLLVVLVGAAYLARARRRGAPGGQDPEGIR